MTKKPIDLLARLQHEREMRILFQQAMLDRLENCPPEGIATVSTRLLKQFQQQHQQNEQLDPTGDDE